MIPGGKIGKPELEKVGKEKFNIPEGPALEEFVKQGEALLETKLAKACDIYYGPSGYEPNRTNKDACVTLFQSKIWNEEDVRPLLKQPYHYTATSGGATQDVDLSMILKDLLKGAETSLAFTYPENVPVGKHKHEAMDYEGLLAYLSADICEKYKVAASDKPAADPAAASAPKAEDTPIGINVKKLEFHTPSPLDNAQVDTKGTLIADVWFGHSLWTRSAYGVEANASLEHTDAAGFDNTTTLALKRGLRGRKLETEVGVGFTVALPLNGSMVEVSAPAKKLIETVKARWGEKAANIFLEAVAKKYLEKADSDTFLDTWAVVTNYYADTFESVLTNKELPSSDDADDLAEVFKYSPSALVDLIALVSGKAADEIKTALSVRGFDLKQIDSVDSFEDLLTQVNKLGWTRQKVLANDFATKPSTSSLAAPTSVADLQLSEKADTTFEINPMLKSDLSLNVYPMVSLALSGPLLKSEEGIVRGADYLLYGEYDHWAFNAKPEDQAHSFLGMAKLHLALQQWTKWDATFKWVAVAQKPSDGNLELIKHVPSFELKAALWKDSYAKGSIAKVFQGNTTQQTAPNGLNDGTSGQGSDSGQLTLLAGRNERILKASLGYKFSDKFSLEGVFSHAQSCDVLVDTDCINRSFVGAFTTFNF